MRTRALLIAAALTLAAGCSSSDSPDVKSGADVAKVVDCSGYTADQDQQYITDGGTCQVDGEDVLVYYFADNGNRDKWVDMATSLAGGSYLVGDHFVIQASAKTLEQMKPDAGGDIKS